MSLGPSGEARETLKRIAGAVSRVVANAKLVEKRTIIRMSDDDLQAHVAWHKQYHPDKGYERAMHEEEIISRCFENSAAALYRAVVRMSNYDLMAAYDKASAGELPFKDSIGVYRHEVMTRLRLGDTPD